MGNVDSGSMCPGFHGAITALSLAFFLADNRLFTASSPKTLVCMDAMLVFNHLIYNDDGCYCMVRDVLHSVESSPPVLGWPSNGKKGLDTFRSRVLVASGWCHS